MVAGRVLDSFPALTKILTFQHDMRVLMQLFDGWHLLSDDVSLAPSLFYLKLMVSVELGVGYSN